jgi:DNA/RNA endonuclease YhcR with UshA esterase domain
MRLLKILTCLLALSSTIAFVLASRATPRQHLAIESVRPAMNFAYVRIEGVIPAHPTLSEEDGYLSFRVLDDTGEMRVSAYRSTVERLLAQGRVPMPGDRVIVEGTLRIRDDDASLILNAPDAVMIETSAAAPIRLAALDAMALGERAQVSGQVRRVRDVGEALRIVTLRDGNAVADVLLPLNLSAFANPPTLQPGDWISVTGGVGEYRGAKQLLPSSPDNLVVFDRPTADEAEAARPISALHDGLLGQWVAIEGEVSDLRPMSSGMRVVVSEADGGTLMMVLFDSLWQTLPFSQTLSVGDRVRAQGELAEYRGELELLPELTVDVALAR